MNTQHTPGPWKLSEFPNDPDQFQVFNPQTGLNIAHVNKWSVQSESELKANARLIAASPELLEALQNAIQVIESLIAGNRVVNLDEALAFYNSLINKATEGQ